MNKEKICQNCKYHYIEEISFDYPQSCCAKEKTHHTTERWCSCDKFEGNKEYFNNLEKYITKLELERDKQKEVLDKIKEYINDDTIFDGSAMCKNDLERLLEEIE